MVPSRNLRRYYANYNSHINLDFECGDGRAHGQLSLYNLRRVLCVKTHIRHETKRRPRVVLCAGWIAMMGAIALIVLADIQKLEELMDQVEWTTLVFFAGLFILMQVRWYPQPLSYTASVLGTAQRYGLRVLSLPIPPTPSPTPSPPLPPLLGNIVHKVFFFKRSLRFSLRMYPFQTTKLSQEPDICKLSNALLARIHASILRLLDSYGYLGSVPNSHNSRARQVDLARQLTEVTSATYLAMLTQSYLFISGFGGAGPDGLSERAHRESHQGIAQSVT